ncbi:MAG: BamA/OMP85 family outer membrane protein, partial [Planctomycetota bacterium]
MTLLRPLVVAGLLATAPLAAADGPSAISGKVVEVVVEGTNRIHPDRILARIQTHAGVGLDEALVNDDVRTIEEMGAFANTTKLVERVGPGQVRVVFRVQELPYVGEIVISGVGYFTRDPIEKLLTTSEGGHLNPMLLEADRRAIERHLRDKKFLTASVTVHSETDTDSGVSRVEFVIDLGISVTVARTRFHGLPRGAHKELIDPLLMNKPGSPFQNDLIELHDRGAVLRYLHGLGYLDARVTGDDVEFFDAVAAYEDRARHGPRLVPEGLHGNRVVITYRIEAGERYRLRDVRFVGNTIASETELRTAYGLPAGSWFKRDDLDRAKHEALRIIRNQGYARSMIIEDPVADRERHEIDLTLQVREGSPYRIGRIDIDGNHKTKDAVVRRGLRLLPGDLWNDDANDNSRRQIMREGVFANDPGRPLRITPLFESERQLPDDEAKETDLLVEVSEDRTGSFNLNLGFASGIGLIGQVSFTERNFDLWSLLRGDGWRGAAHRLNASASWSDDRTVFALSWTNPHLMDGPWSL